jgi:hypothetical protein
VQIRYYFFPSGNNGSSRKIKYSQGSFRQFPEQADRASPISSGPDNLKTHKLPPPPLPPPSPPPIAPPPITGAATSALHPPPTSHPQTRRPSARRSGGFGDATTTSRGRGEAMFSGEWTPPCGSCCTKKYATLVQIPCRLPPAYTFSHTRPPRQRISVWLIETDGWLLSPFRRAGRVFCKKGCNADGDTWEECEYRTNCTMPGATV